jgi:hypothetical protein
VFEYCWFMFGNCAPCCPCLNMLKRQNIRGIYMKMGGNGPREDEWFGLKEENAVKGSKLGQRKAVCVVFKSRPPPAK